MDKKQKEFMKFNSCTFVVYPSGYYEWECDNHWCVFNPVKIDIDNEIRPPCPYDIDKVCTNPKAIRDVMKRANAIILEKERHFDTVDKANLND